MITNFDTKSFEGFFATNSHIIEKMMDSYVAKNAVIYNRIVTKITDTFRESKGYSVYSTDSYMELDCDIEDFKNSFVEIAIETKSKSFSAMYGHCIPFSITDYKGIRPSNKRIVYCDFTSDSNVEREINKLVDALQDNHAFQL